MKKVISIALFGDASKKDGSGTSYADYLAAFVLAHHNIYPRAEGWELRLHVDEPVLNSDAGDFFMRLNTRQLLVVQCHDEAPRTKAMLWRMASVFDDDSVDYVFCRDLDAPPMPRDRACMEQFIASQMAVHTVHDAPVHVGVMGGLCGFRAAAFREGSGLKLLEDLYKFAGDVEWERHGTDQNVLNRLLAERPRLTLLEHRYNGWWNGPGAKEKARAGQYHCRAFSTPTPNVGAVWQPDGDEVTGDEADRLGAHLGCAGYDIAAARTFWEKHGDPEIARQVRECEKET